ncbi:hypothetical protein MASR1M48_17150 [Lactococcus petauri]
MQQTQLDSWEDLQKHIGKRQLDVFQAITHLKGATCYEVSIFLNIPINRVSGRITELAKKNLIITNKTRVNPTSGKLNAVWEQNESKTTY